MHISKKDHGKRVGIHDNGVLKRERESVRERETDMCGSSQRKPLEAKVLNLALRSDESERFLVPHCVEQDLSPALCLLLLVVTTPRIYLIGSGPTESITPEKDAKG